VASCLAVLLALAGCQPLPHPFETEEKGFNPLLQLKDGVGVTVLPATGVPSALGRQLAEALAAAFRDAEVPAAVEDGNRGSFVVTGAGRLGPELEIEWDLAAPSGELLGNVVQRERLAAGSGEPTLPPDRLAAMARAGVAKLVPLVRDDTAAVLPNAIQVGTIDGAPGDGAASLRRAVEFVLRQSDIPVASADHPHPLTLVATVDLGRAAEGRQRIAIRWVLLMPDGSEVGDVRQENAVPAGSLDRNWGPTALLVAEAAYDGIIALYEKVPTIVSH
jgi:hypothetical protein